MPTSEGKIEELIKSYGVMPLDIAEEMAKEIMKLFKESFMGMIEPLQKEHDRADALAENEEAAQEEFETEDELTGYVDGIWWSIAKLRKEIQKI